MGNLARDARIGLRMLSRNPGFAAVAALTLALGIAANTTIFSVVYATFIAPLPYHEADRLVMLWSQLEGNRNTNSAADFVEWRRQATSFDDLNAWGQRSVNLATRDRPEHLRAGIATPAYLAMQGYGHPLALGRDFLAEEGTVGRDQVAILSHRLWRERFGADPEVVGKPIRIDGKPYIVVGVLGAGPADLHIYPLWIPLAFTPEQLDHGNGNREFTVMGRLKRGVTVEQANAEMAAITRRLTEAHPDTHAGWSVSVEPFRNDFLSEDTKRGLWLLLGAVVFVLLISCANVANLLLARGTARERELAVRAALGASRREVVRQLITESLVLAFAGGVLGVALAHALLRLVVALIPPDMLPTEADIRLNVPVLLFTFAACALSGVLAGCAPAWQAARTSFSSQLRQGGPSLGSGGHRLRQGLVVLEFALALTLLTGGGLAMQSLLTLATRDLGFQTRHLLTLSLPVPEDRHTTHERTSAFYRELLERVQATPGVLSASISTSTPLRPTFGMPIAIAGRPRPDSARRDFALFNMVSAAYLETLGIRLEKGRGFTERDTAGGLRVAMVNETFVKRYLPDVDPLGQRVLVPALVPGAAGPGPIEEWQVVGVFKDARSFGPRNTAQAEIAVPFWQSPWPSARMAIRTSGDPTGVRQAISSIVQRMDPDLPLADVKTMDQVVSESLAGDRFNTALFGSFAAVGLLLAALGVYGVMSFVVAQRTREIGLRMALGAERSDVLREVLRDGMKTALAGTVLGSAGAWYAARTLRGVVHGIGDLGPAPFVGVALTLLCAALLACLMPALRAASVQPMLALRQE